MKTCSLCWWGYHNRQTHREQGWEPYETELFCMELWRVACKYELKKIERVR